LIKWLKRLQTVPRLLLAYASLRADVEDALGNPQIRAALDRFRSDPAVAPLFPRISAEWRAVEEAVHDMR